MEDEATDNLGSVEDLIERADNEMAKVCNSRLTELYGDNPPRHVKERLDFELNSIFENGYAVLYMIAQKLVEKSNDAGYMVGSRGCVGASLVAYLLGITEIDPIKYDIPFETLSGIDGNKMPDIVLNVSGDYQTSIHKYAEEVFGKDKLKFGILGHDSPTIIKKLEDLTGVDARTIPLDDVKTLDMLINTDALGVPEFGDDDVRDIMKIAEPKTFDDFVKILGLSYGTGVWRDNAEPLIRTGAATVSEVIALRDEIMVYLMSRGISRQVAYEIMENVRMGRRLSKGFEDIMTKSGVPEWFIQSCNKIGYLFPKAHAVAYAMMSFRVAWFKAHHPEVFSIVLQPRR